MALTVTIDERATLGHLKLNVVQVTFDNSYPTGGEALTAADLGLQGDPVAVFVEGQDGYVFQYDYANAKVLAYEAGADGAALDEVADTTDLSAVANMRVIAIGR